MHLITQACADYLELAQTQGRKWQKSLQYERDQRLRLEETIETLAKQHNVLEQACRTVKKKGKFIYLVVLKMI